MRSAVRPVWRMRRDLKMRQSIWICWSRRPSGMDLRDPERFLDDVDGLFARPDAQSDGKLQLLTIHKAKGLEFDTVILPGLGRYSRSDAPRLLLWLEYMDRSENAQLLLAPIKESGTESDPTYAYVRKIQTAKAANESMRLLYVAATRARSHLHLLGHTEIDLKSGAVKEPDSRTLLKRFWPAAVSQFRKCCASRIDEWTIAELQRQLATALRRNSVATLERELAGRAASAGYRMAPVCVECNSWTKTPAASTFPLTGQRIFSGMSALSSMRCCRMADEERWF